MRSVKVATFNINNLFSRFNFAADVTDGEKVTFQGQTTYTFNEGAVTLRTFQGRLVAQKPIEQRQLIASRIRSVRPDILAVQEVEDLDTLKAFVKDELEDEYPFVSLIEGNDARLIDVGLISRLPLGSVTSWRHAVHPSKPEEAVFGRDLVETEILSPTRDEVYFRVFNTHLKSHLVLPNDPPGTSTESDARRARQAEVIAEILRQRGSAEGSIVLLGDMNDPPTSPALGRFSELGLRNGLTEPRETRSAPVDPSGGPSSAAWTHRYKPAGQPAEYSLFDQIWLSAALAARQMDAAIDRRTKLSGDGSDHDMAWIELEV